ncbi:MAG: hypothetical protein V1856_00730 [Candidatus Liptonbacteria bacterium]
MFTNQNHQKCELCGSEKVRKWIYGTHPKSAEDVQKLKNEGYAVGGDIIRNDSPAFFCDNCGKDFGAYGMLVPNKE